MSTAPSDSISKRIQERIRRVIDLHFDTLNGSAYWIEKSKVVGIRAEHIKTFSDLALLGPMDARAMAERPVEDFVPRVLHESRRNWILSETGGTLGRPKFSVHGQVEFEAAFVTPFVSAAKKAGFPEAKSWLFIGPGGPHIIGKAARACAHALNSPDPFSIDFDPRWARKLPADSLARQRYLNHLEVQALNVLNSQKVGVLFATPPVLASLADKVAPRIREQIKGIHFGGMTVSSELRSKLAQFYPNAIQLSGYGNSMLGVAPELHYDPADGIDYYTQGVRLIYQIIPMHTDRFNSILPYGERGHILAHRLDETQLILNLIERDTAIRIPSREDASSHDFVLDGIRDPQPFRNVETQAVSGLY